MSKLVMATPNGGINDSKEQIVKDAMLILNEIPETDLNISNNSIEEINYTEKYQDPEFQNLLLSLKRLCKRERMLVTVFKKHIKDVESDKESAEHALSDFMQKSSVPLLDSSNLNDSNFTKNMFQSMQYVQRPSNGDFTVSNIDQFII